MSEFEERLRTQLQSDRVEVPLDVKAVLDGGHEAVRGRRLGWTVAGMATAAVVASIATSTVITSTVPAVPAPAASPSPTLSPPPTLAGTAWEAVRIGGVPRIPDTRVTLQFLDGTVRGSSGCNAFDQGLDQTDGYRQDGDRLSISGVAGTLVGCGRTDVAEQDGRFLALLREVARFRISAGNLVLLAPDGTELAELAPFEIEGRTWELDGLTGAWAGDDPGITLRVDGERVSGWSGCGAYTASLSRDGVRWKLSDVRIPSPIPCPSAAGTRVGIFIERLEKVTAGELFIARPTLRLRTPDGDLLFLLVR